MKDVITSRPITANAASNPCSRLFSSEGGRGLEAEDGAGDVIMVGESEGDGDNTGFCAGLGI